MSKNFELLQQVGNGEEVFQTAEQPGDVVATVDAEPNPGLDKESLEKILQKTSLPDVFQIAGEQQREALAAHSELSPHLNAESGSRNLQSDTSASAFRASRSQTGRTGELGKHSANRVTPSSAKSASVPKTLPRGTKPKAIPGTGIQEPPPKLKGRNQQGARQRLSLLPPWLDSIRSGAKGWARNVREWNKYYGEDLEAITRGEEIKLVQRVFPGTDEGSPRTVLFARLDGEAGCAPTCARVAEMLAARGEGPVCVVDANFHAPSLHEYFGVENANGLAEATVEPGPIQSFAQQIPEPDLWLMPSGRAAAQLRFPAMADGLRVRMEELRNTFRYVVIHSGPLRLETSAMLLSRWTDGVVLVLEANATRRDAARRIKKILDAANVNVLGVVLSNRTFPIPEAIYRRL